MGYADLECVWSPNGSEMGGVGATGVCDTIMVPLGFTRSSTGNLSGL